MSTGKMTGEDYWAIARLMSEFCWKVDHGQGAEMGELFTADARVVTPRFNLGNRDEIVAWFTARSKNTELLTRHSWAAPRFEMQSASRIKVTSVATTILGKTPAPAAGAQIMIGDALDIVEKEADGQWRFSERVLDVVFEGRIDAVDRTN